MKMDIINQRSYHTKDSTLGILVVNGIPFGFVIEDEPRLVKVKGQTRIPAGRYKLVLRKEDTPLTLKYRKKFPWFKYHIELENVPDFTGIYIHIGNTEKDTDGCQVIGMSAHISGGQFVNSESTSCFMSFYQVIYPLLEAGEEVYYTIIDEK